MNQVQLRGQRVAVEKLKKQSKKDSGSFFVDVETEEFVGLVRFVGSDLKDSDLKVGQKVYFGSQYQPVRMANTDLCVMDEDNVLAIVNETTEK